MCFKFENCCQNIFFPLSVFFRRRQENIKKYLTPPNFCAVVKFATSSQAKLSAPACSSWENIFLAPLHGNSPHNCGQLKVGVAAKLSPVVLLCEKGLLSRLSRERKKMSSAAFRKSQPRQHTHSLIFLFKVTASEALDTSVASLLDVMPGSERTIPHHPNF